MDKLHKEEALLDKEYAVVQGIDDLAREKLPDRSLATFMVLNYWTRDLNVGLSEFVFEKNEEPSLGRAVASVFANMLTSVDDYFDTHRKDFLGMTAGQLKNSMLEMEVTPEDTSQGISVKVEDVMVLVREYVDTIPSGFRKDETLRSIADFENRTFPALAWEVSVDRTTYSHQDALLHKFNTLEPFYRLVYTLGAERKFDIEKREKIGSLLVVAQLDDDIRDFDEDLKQGNVNVEVGFYNEMVLKGADAGEARQKALEKSKLMSKQMKLTTGYYLVGLQVIISKYLENLKGH